MSAKCDNCLCCGQLEICRYPAIIRYWCRITASSYVHLRCGTQEFYEANPRKTSQTFLRNVAIDIEQLRSKVRESVLAARVQFLNTTISRRVSLASRKNTFQQVQNVYRYSILEKVAKISAKHRCKSQSRETCNSINLARYT